MQDFREPSEKVSPSAEISTNIGEMAGQAKQKAAETLEQVKQQAQSKFDEQKEQAADRLSGVADALHQTSQELGGQDETLAQYVDSFAKQVEGVSGYLRERDLSELFNDVRQVAQRQPEIFVAGALAAGFLLGRFLKSSGSRPSNGGDNGRQYGDTRPRFQPTYDNAYGNQGGSSVSAFTSPEVSRTDWMVEPFSSTQEIPVTGEENDAR